jgi:hypothetical protein
MSFSLGRTESPYASKVPVYISHVGRFLAFKVITRLRNVFSQNHYEEEDEALLGALGH